MEVVLHKKFATKYSAEISLKGSPQCVHHNEVVPPSQSDSQTEE
jgi:hypothetical protein